MDTILPGSYYKKESGKMAYNKKVFQRKDFQLEYSFAKKFFFNLKNIMWSCVGYEVCVWNIIFIFLSVNIIICKIRQ